MTTITAPTPTTAQQIIDSYRTIANATNYHPGAPSDGHGTTTDTDLERDAATYLHDWWTSETERRFEIGCPSWSDRPALIYTIEAARVICGNDGSDRDRDVIAGLLRLALDALANRSDTPCPAPTAATDPHQRVSVDQYPDGSATRLVTYLEGEQIISEYSTRRTPSEPWSDPIRLCEVPT